MTSEESIIETIGKHDSFITKCGRKIEAISKSLENSVAKYISNTASNIVDHANIEKEQLRARISRETTELKDRYETDVERENQSFETSIAEKKSRLAKMQEEHPAECLPWNYPFWDQFRPSRKIEAPPLTRFGELTVRGDINTINVPALLRIITSKNLLINASSNYKEAALEALQTVMLRLLVTVPPGKVNFILIDPVGLGSNMAGFMHLPEEIVGGKIWTEANHIERQLSDLSIQMEAIIQKYLRNNFATMEDYNKEAGEVAEPYRFLVVANFPVNFNEAAAQRLISIASNGARTGVYTLVMRDTEQVLPYNFKIEELERLSTIIEHNGSRFEWKDDKFDRHELALDKLPDVKAFNGLLELIGAEAKLASHVEVSFAIALNDIKEWWSLKSDGGISVPIGRAGANRFQYFSLGKNTLQHVLVGGKTGSGKSNLLHVLIMSLCINHSPDDLELYLIDFKKGIEFKSYATMKLPHAKVIAIQSEREFGLSVLQGLDAELQRRGDVFRDAGVQNLQEFRQKNAGIRTPRIVLLVDEFQEFFTEDDQIANQCALLLDRLVRQGRAFGIHIILASQALAGVYTLSRSTTDQMAIRIALQCSDTDSRLILGEDNPNARLLSRPGEAIYNDANGLIEGNSLFQAFYLSDKNRDQYLQELYSLYQVQPSVRPLRQIVFEGNAPASIEGNGTLHALLSATEWPGKASRLLAWLGEPIAIKPHTAAGFQKQSRSNMMIVGQNEEASCAMLINSLVGLAAQASPNDIEFHLVDLSKADAPWNMSINSLPRILPHQTTVYAKRDVGVAIEKLESIVKEREDGMGSEPEKSVFLYIVGLHRARDLKSDDGYTYPPSTEKLFYILNHGPDYGVHTVFWGDTFKNIERVLGRNNSEFDLRVALQMSLNESNQVIDSPEANKLGQFRALSYDEEKTGSLEKFRPYALPHSDWLEFVYAQLAKRGQ
jgi:hypothetical protein